tara:strand:- start:13608 stop:13853 length:246 start_codon:yes stop_codon:yes gene_type:complete
MRKGGRYLNHRETINGHTFELVDNCYECRGGSFYDEDHDQVPEPSLQIAADELEASLKEDGINAYVEYGEKGWIEVYLDLD